MSSSSPHDLFIKDLFYFTGVGNSTGISSGTPSRLPLGLYTTSLGLVAAHQTPELMSALNRAYRKGSLLSSPPGEAMYANTRSDEAIEYLLSALGSVKGKRILEIGCGPGDVLSHLVKLGATVVGCEPGPSALKAKASGIEVVNSFFLPNLFQASSFDAVISWMVLEHISNPIASLQEMLTLLRPNGVIIAAVPDCEPLLRIGDPNLMAHEHLWYFTPKSIERVFLEAGLREVEVEHSRRTLSLICRGTAEGSDRQSLTAKDASLVEFARLHNERMMRLQARIKMLQGQSLGWVGASLAAANLMSLLDLKGVNLRIFEADGSKIGHHFLELNHIIESDEDLVKLPPDEIWVLPHLMGSHLVQKLIGVMPSKTKVLALKDI